MQMYGLTILYCNVIFLAGKLAFVLFVYVYYRCKTKLPTGPLHAPPYR